MVPSSSVSPSKSSFKAQFLYRDTFTTADSLEIHLQSRPWQALTYSYSYRCDPFAYVLQVATLILADTVNVILNAMYLHDALITHFGDAERLARTNWMFATDPFLMGITACIAQLFFAWRVRIVTQHIWPAILIGCFSVTSFIGAIGCGVGNFFVKRFEEFPKLTSVLIIWLLGSVCADVLIAGSLTWHLVRFSLLQRYVELQLLIQKTRPAFRSTDIIVDRIIAIILPTGLLQAAFAILNLALFLGLPPPRSDSGTQFIFNFLLSKLFTNSILSSLNARNPPGSEVVETQQLSVHLPRLSAMGASNVRLPPMKFQAADGIASHREEWQAQLRQSVATRDQHKSSEENESEMSK